MPLVFMKCRCCIWAPQPSSRPTSVVVWEGVNAAEMYWYTTEAFLTCGGMAEQFFFLPPPLHMHAQVPRSTRGRRERLWRCSMPTQCAELGVVEPSRSQWHASQGGARTGAGRRRATPSYRPHTLLHSRGNLPSRLVSGSRNASPQSPGKTRYV
ncbi:hypothetical protein GQ53DRAFT_458518 [Thozetella sp. PMI_491]|nr:hypothetical protein GQ53DRAFT_458518 [Thozetella sp. PMI_491]